MIFHFPLHLQLEVHQIKRKKEIIKSKNASLMKVEGIVQLFFHLLAQLLSLLMKVMG